MRGKQFIKVDNRHTILFYIFCLVGLVIITALFTTQEDLVEISKLPTTITPIQPTSTPTPTTTPTQTKPTGCDVTVDEVRQRYIPDRSLPVATPPTDLTGNEIIIAGIVYASDCITPLTNVLVEVWPADKEGQFDHSAPFTSPSQTRTDATGRYAFTLLATSETAPHRQPPARIYYRVSYPEKRPSFSRGLFGGDLHLTTVPFSLPAFSGMQVAHQNLDGPLLRGKFDIVLPIHPSITTPTPTGTPQSPIHD